MSAGSLRRRVDRLEDDNGLGRDECPKCHHRDPAPGEMGLADALAVLERPAGLPEGEPVSDSCTRCGRPVMTLAAALAIVRAGPPWQQEAEN